MRKTRKSVRLFPSAALLCFLLVQASPVRAAATLELYGTFHAMGIIAPLEAGDDPEENATARLEYRPAGAASYREGFPLSRVAADRFVGSLFFLEPGTSYDVRVSFSDPDGGGLDGQAEVLTGATRPEISVPAPTRSLYVSPSGSGSNCTLAEPCPLSEGLSQALPGEEVVLLGGTYYEGGFYLPRSGAPGAPIVIRGQTGETAILDGGDPAVFTWTDQGGGVFHTTANAPDTHLVTADGSRLYPYQSLGDLQSLLWGIPGLYANGTDLYVRLAGDADPNGAAMVVSRFNNAFTVEQSDIYFLNLTFRHYGQGAYAKAIYFKNAGDNLVKGCTFAVNDLGIGIKRDSPRNVIEDNEFYDTDSLWPWDAVKAGSGLETGGVRFYDPATGRGNVIRRNTFHDYFDGFGVCPGATAGTTNETDVYENLVYRAGDDGMETDGQCSNVRIWKNTFHDVLIGISLAPVYTGPVYAIRNLVYRTGYGNSIYTGSPFKFNSGSPGSGPMFIFHTTGDAVTAGNNSLFIRSPGSWTRITARNNIWSATEYALYNANASQPLDLDYDDLYTTMAGELAWWEGLPDRHLNTLAELQAAAGQEPNGLNVVPGFQDAPTGDYTLAPGSEVIDRGILIPGINDDFSGAGPDMGAFETMESADNLRKASIDPALCPLSGPPDLASIFPLPPPGAAVTLPWEDPFYRLPPSDPQSPLDNSCLIFYQVDGCPRIAVVPGQTSSDAVRLEAF
jgi:hypothetical protein